MQSFVFLLLAAAIVAACIWFLHRAQRRRTVETAELTAPLDALDNSQLRDIVGDGAQKDAQMEAQKDAQKKDTAVLTDSSSWLGQIRVLRESGQLDAALSMSKAHFPKTQAFQQAAIILRQQIREGLEHSRPVESALRELFHTAAIADLFRTNSSHKPQDPQAALAAVRDLSFHYAAIGHLRLKLLNKSDVRALEQLWGNPGAHRHVEEVLGEDWLKWCRAPA
jgi:hypothetical protein